MLEEKLAELTAAIQGLTAALQQQERSGGSTGVSTPPKQDSNVVSFGQQQPLDFGQQQQQPDFGQQQQQPDFGQQQQQQQPDFGQQQQPPLTVDELNRYLVSMTAVIPAEQIKGLIQQRYGSASISGIDPQHYGDIKNDVEHLYKQVSS